MATLGQQPVTYPSPPPSGEYRRMKLMRTVSWLVGSSMGTGPCVRSYSSSAETPCMASNGSHEGSGYPVHLTNASIRERRPRRRIRMSRIASTLYSCSPSTTTGGGSESSTTCEGSGSVAASRTSSTWNTGWTLVGTFSRTVCGVGTSSTSYLACNQSSFFDGRCVRTLRRFNHTRSCTL